MSTIGIISVPEKRLSKMGKMFNSVVIKEVFGESPKYIVAETAANDKDITTMSRRRVKKLMKKAERLLLTLNADAVLLSERCKELNLSNYCSSRDKRYKIPAKKIFECFFFSYKKAHMFGNYDTLHIFDPELRAITYEELLKVCLIVKYITLHTLKKDRALMLAEQLFYEYGVCIKISDIVNINEERNVQMLIDVENRKVRIGDFCIDGAEFYSKSGLYALDAAEEAAVLGENIDFQIKSWMSGKNVIKIS